jgi:hypothetical protein
VAAQLRQGRFAPIFNVNETRASLPPPPPPPQISGGGAAFPLPLSFLAERDAAIARASIDIMTSDLVRDVMKATAGARVSEHVNDFIKGIGATLLPPPAPAYGAAFSPPRADSGPRPVAPNVSAHPTPMEADIPLRAATEYIPSIPTPLSYVGGAAGFSASPASHRAPASGVFPLPQRSAGADLDDFEERLAAALRMSLEEEAPSTVHSNIQVAESNASVAETLLRADISIMGVVPCNPNDGRRQALRGICLRNTSDTSWPADTRLVLLTGDALGMSADGFYVGPLPVNESLSLAMSLAIPVSPPDDFTSIWRLRAAGCFFGPPLGLHMLLDDLI